jgi:hypothetical protein
MVGYHVEEVALSPVKDMSDFVLLVKMNSIAKSNYSGV